MVKCCLAVMLVCSPFLVMATSIDPRPVSPTGLSWSGFRGPRSAGVADSNAAFPSDLNATNALRWKIATLPGHSSPIVVGDLIFITGYEDGKLSTLCYDRFSGDQRWRRDEPTPHFEKFYSHGPATPTPVSDGERVFVVFGSCGVLAYDLAGKELWRQTRPVQQNVFGSASSPVLAAGKLIVFAGTEKESLLQALEPATGKVLWERKRQGAASSWATPVAWGSGEREAILIYEPFHLRSIAIGDGADLWSVPGLADEPVTTPQFAGDLILTTSYNLRTNQEATGIPTFETLLAECDANQDGLIDGDEAKTNKSILSRPDADGQGDHPLRMFFSMLDADKNGQINIEEWPRIKSWTESWNHANGLVALRPGEGGSTPTLAWEHASGVPECPSPLVIKDHIFMVRNGGVVTCLNATSGKQIFKQRLGEGGPYYASPVSADDKIYLASERGVLTVLAAVAEPKVLSSKDLGEAIWATPALIDGEIIVRSERHLWRFAIAESK